MAPLWLDELDLRDDGPPWLAIGLRRVDEDGWLVADEHRDDELALRRDLIAQRADEVVHLGAGTEAAGAEVLAQVRSWLAAHDLRSPVTPGPHPVGGDPSGAQPTNGGARSRHGVLGAPRSGSTEEHPLVTAARLVQEDLCLMVPRPDVDGVAHHHLDAAVLCFPSHWRLADKAGRPAAALHGPVPLYDSELADRVDRYLARLRPGVIGVRRNWSVHDSPALFAPDPPVDPGPVEPDEVPEALWLRSERQTLRALPRSGSVLFTIRVQQAPFAVLADRPDVADALAARLRAQPAQLVAMNGLEPHLAPALEWLDGVGAST